MKPMDSVLHKLTLKYWQYPNNISEPKFFDIFFFFLALLHLVHLQYEDGVLPLRYFTSVDHVSVWNSNNKSPDTLYTHTIIKTLIPAQTMDCATSSFTYRMIETSFCQTPSAKQQILRPSMTFDLVEEVRGEREAQANETKCAWVCQVQRYKECKASTDWSSFRWKSPSFLWNIMFVWCRRFTQEDKHTIERAKKVKTNQNNF